MEVYVEKGLSNTNTGAKVLGFGGFFWSLYVNNTVNLGGKLKSEACRPMVRNICVT